MTEVVVEYARFLEVQQRRARVVNELSPAEMETVATTSATTSADAAASSVDHSTTPVAEPPDQVLPQPR